MYTNFHQHVLDLEEKPHQFKVREVKYPHRKGGWSQRVCTISSVTARHSSLTVLWAPKPTKQKRGVYTQGTDSRSPAQNFWIWEDEGGETEAHRAREICQCLKLLKTKTKNWKRSSNMEHADPSSFSKVSWWMGQEASAGLERAGEQLVKLLGGGG